MIEKCYGLKNEICFLLDQEKQKTFNEIERKLPKEEPFLDSKTGCGCGVCNQIEMRNKTIQEVKRIIKSIKEEK